MAEENSFQIYCHKCGKTLSATEFYGSYNLEKYPNGKLKECKKCITMHVDNWNPDTYLWILQECDVPYIPKEWFKLMEKYAKDPKSVTGASIIGRYLAKMRLNQHKKYRWKDTEFLQKLEASKIEQALTVEGYDTADITMAIERSNALLPDVSNIEQFIPEVKHLDLEKTANVVGGPPPRPEFAPPIADYFGQQNNSEEYFNNDLTDEDKTYLRIKWGSTYRPDEWVKLEDLYDQMMKSYDIQGAAHIDTLKLICKTSLKAN